MFSILCILNDRSVQEKNLQENPSIGSSDTAR